MLLRTLKKIFMGLIQVPLKCTFPTLGTKCFIVACMNCYMNCSFNTHPCLYSCSLQEKRFCISLPVEIVLIIHNKCIVMFPSEFLLTLNNSLPETNFYSSVSDIKQHLIQNKLIYQCITLKYGKCAPFPFSICEFIF